MAAFSALAWLAVLPAAVLAAPTLEPRQAVSALSTSQIASFKPFTHYASTAYCSPASTLAWNCGPNCEANPTFKPIASGGDGGAVQFWYVGFDPTLDTVIVGHQGTDASKILADLTDANFILEPLNPKLFPGVGLPVLAHAGFVNEHAKTATQILAAVNTAISRFNATHVTIVGHSLGAALALVESVYLPLHLPSSITFKTVGYGMPRVGNQAFADYVDTHVQNVNHINNKKDPIPTLPPLLFGYHHPSGEIHITESEAWEACTGQDNRSELCTLGDVPTLLQGDGDDHSGPFDGVVMGC